MYNLSKENGISLKPRSYDVTLADASKPFILRTGSSNYALGAVLPQGDDKTNELPIEYASQLLIGRKNYSTTEKEALSVVWALEKFYDYVESQEITVVTDHQSLK
ncbi:endonuclease [Caerostris darwini]|uniref:Endonuclease n=1 Tax=Caerostris darwini TaxID=1538125 RepID=A0AAV4TNG8_9ARAC|nr:endonuclease [Caerostris darwini]